MPLMKIFRYFNPKNVQYTKFLETVCRLKDLSNVNFFDTFTFYRFSNCIEYKAI